MDHDTRRVLGVLAVLVLAVAAFFAWWGVRSARAPVITEVHVVYMPAGDGVASDTPPEVAVGTEVRVAALVAFRRGSSGPETWMCPLQPVELAGRRLEVIPLGGWPASGGVLRAVWYSVEPSLFGWENVGPGDAGEKLAYKDFLAPEMGRDLEAPLSWEAHNDDFVSVPPAGNTLPGGVRRIKVRVATYPDENGIIPLQSVASPGAGAVLGGGLPALVREIDLPTGIDPRVAGWLRLGCFTFAEGVWPDGGPGWPLPLSPAEEVRHGLIATPRAIAAAAGAGDPLADPWLAAVAVTSRGGALTGAAGRPLVWGVDLAPGDALRAGDQYFTLVADMGDGVLSLDDRVLFAWHEPACMAPLAVALESAEPIELLRLRKP